MPELWKYVHIFLQNILHDIDIQGSLIMLPNIYVNIAVTIFKWQNNLRGTWQVAMEYDL
jgi:hypothetical protein